ncbi:MAG: sigma-70 family RNA polymerase sigma factor [Propionibacteriaceae bacterium]
MGAGQREAALQELHDRHAAELWRFAMRLTHDRQLSEDVVQEVLLKAWKDPSLGQRDEAAARAWLFTASRNLIIDKWRSASSRHEQRIEEPPEEGVGDATSVVLDRWLIAEALGSLSMEHRSVINAAYYEGRSVADISARLRIPEGTVKSRLHYGLRTLRLALQKKGVTRPWLPSPTSSRSGMRRMCWVRFLLLSDGSSKNIWPHCQTAVSELAAVMRFWPSPRSGGPTAVWRPPTVIRRLRAGRGTTGRPVWECLNMNGRCTHLDRIRDVTPSSWGCEDCLAQGRQDWVHLRICQQCGHVGCCDNSPGRHATAHFRLAGHPVIRSYEPGEDWYWCYLDQLAFELEGSPPAPSHP